jgi:hypothetical protein
LRASEKITGIEARTDVEMICPRCGTPRRPIGPRLSLDGWGRGCLRYACYGCGYGWTERASDQERADHVVRLPVRQPRGDVAAAKPDHHAPTGASKYRVAG